jgi:hypothetical protein
VSWMADQLSKERIAFDDVFNTRKAIRIEVWTKRKAKVDGLEVIADLLFAQRVDIGR